MNKQLTLNEAVAFIFTRPYKEIAERTGLTISTVGARKTRHKAGKMSDALKLEMATAFGFKEVRAALYKL